MNFDLTDEQRMWREVVHDFVAKEVKPKARHVDETGIFNWGTLQKMGANDLLIIQAMIGIGKTDVQIFYQHFSSLKEDIIEYFQLVEDNDLLRQFLQIIKSILEKVNRFLLQRLQKKYTPRLIGKGVEGYIAFKTWPRPPTISAI